MPFPGKKRANEDLVQTYEIRLIDMRQRSLRQPRRKDGKQVPQVIGTEYLPRNKKGKS